MFKNENNVILITCALICINSRIEMWILDTNDETNLKKKKKKINVLSVHKSENTSKQAKTKTKVVEKKLKAFYGHVFHLKSTDANI